MPYPKLDPTPVTRSVPLPAGLPAPVDRFFRTTVGERVPVIESAVISARGSFRLFGVTIPLRMRLIHQAGQGYRRYMEGTCFGLPLFKFDEQYLDGVSVVFSPTGPLVDNAKMNQASNLALWAESVNLPSILVTDPRVRWEAIDDTHARLVVPAPQGTDTFVVAFDPQTGLIQTLESLRWAGPNDKARRLWQNRASNWQRAAGLLLGLDASASWDHGKPWLTFTVEDVVYNTDVSKYIRAEGP